MTPSLPSLLTCSPSGPFVPFPRVVCTTLLNHRPVWTALGEAAHQAPYKAPAQAPVLGVKPRNTWAVDGDDLTVPESVEALEIGPALGIVIGQTAARLTPDNALAYVAGYVLVNEVSLPRESHYRPAVRFMGRDGFCPLTRTVVPAAHVADPDALAVRVWVDEVLVHESSTGDRLRSVATLLADVTAFMTLQPGDVLTLGAPAAPPLARVGQQVRLAIDGVGQLQHRVVRAAAAQAETPQSASASLTPPVRLTPTARVAYAGAVHTVTPHPQGVRLADGRVVAEDAVVWLAPFEVGTVIALGLNYADHVKELSKELTVTAKDEPLVFLKTPGSVIGHRGQTQRPAGVKFMHYECELAVVIGRTAHRVRRQDAMQHVAGYTVCNDYAVRDYLENWYRPNLRVKNRDGGTVLGPWFVPASAVPEPHALGLRTLVNGQCTQQGSTANMVNDIPALIEYLSEFMTLQPGDVILTGTPEGVVNVNAGDEVVCEIDGIGRLVNHIVSETASGDF